MKTKMTSAANTNLKGFDVSHAWTALANPGCLWGHPLSCYRTGERGEV